MCLVSIGWCQRRNEESPKDRVTLLVAFLNSSEDPFSHRMFCFCICFPWALSAHASPVHPVQFHSIQFQVIHGFDLPKLYCRRFFGQLLYQLTFCEIHLCNSWSLFAFSISVSAQPFSIIFWDYSLLQLRWINISSTFVCRLWIRREWIYLNQRLAPGGILL